MIFMIVSSFLQILNAQTSSPKGEATNILMDLLLIFQSNSAIVKKAEGVVGPLRGRISTEFLREAHTDLADQQICVKSNYWVV